ncbi:MAG: tetratricopeptide repeat protein, partial [Gammaproteobacteria bacterium]
AREAVERAFELQPDLAEAHFAMGYYYYHGFRDDENALQEWALAEQGMPGDSRVHLARGYLYRRMGNFEQSLVSLDRAIELDPRNIEQLEVQAISYALLHDYARAESFFDRIIEIAPDRPLGYRNKARISLWRDGDVSSMNAILESAPIEVPAPVLEWTTALYERSYEAALTALNNRFDNWEMETVDTAWIYRPKASYYGVTHELAEEPELAAQQFRAARKEVDQALESRPDDPRVIIALAEILARQGERELAANLARHAMELFPMARDASGGPGAFNLPLNAIRVFVAAEDYDAAIEAFEVYLAAPVLWSIEGLLPDPRLDPIRDDPRFQAFVEKYKRK